MSSRACRGLLLAAVALIVTIVPGCDSNDVTDPGPPPVYSSVTITGGPDSLIIGGQGQFTLAVLDTLGQPVASPQVVFTSTPEGIVTIDAAGKVRGVSEGIAFVTATGGGVSSLPETLSVFLGYGWFNQSIRNSTVLNLNGVWFVSPTEGWAVGDAGIILHTTNAGALWETQVSNSTGYTLRAVAFATPLIGTAVGTAGRIIRTIDGGRSWSPVTADTDNGKALNDVFFQDKNFGWAVGNGGLILRTFNGGASWVRVLPAVSGVDLHSVSFPRLPDGSSPPNDDPWQHGWIVGAIGELLSSDDYGVSWQRFPTFVSSDPWFGVARSTRETAVAVGSNNRIAISFDFTPGEIQWALLSPMWDQSNFRGVTYPYQLSGVPGHEIWAVGKGTLSGSPIVIYSPDDGLTWFEQDLPADAPLISNELRDVFFYDTERGWAVGTQGLMLHTSNGGQPPPFLPTANSESSLRRR